MFERYNIRAVLDPRNGRELSLLDAIKLGLLAQHTGDYIHPTTGEVIPLDRAVAMGLVLVERSASRMSDAEMFEFRCVLYIYRKRMN